MAEFNYRAYVEQFIQDYKRGITYNDSHLKIIRAEKDSSVFRIIGIHKLTSQENVGKHHLFMEVLDGTGVRPENDALIDWGWEGQTPNEIARPVVLDKPLNEPSGNIAIWANQTIWARVLSESSDKVTNVHTRLPDEGSGNTYGHHSYLVVWQEIVEDDNTPPPPPDNTNMAAILQKLRQVTALIKDVESLLSS